MLVHSVLGPSRSRRSAASTAFRKPSPRRAELRPQRARLRRIDPRSCRAPVRHLRAEIGWAFAWRTLIAAELVFGVSAGQGGLGWYIFRNRNELFTDKVFAGLVLVIVIGLLVEGVVFRLLESLTVRRWGMQR